MLSDQATAQQTRKLPIAVLATVALPVALACGVLFCFDPRRYHFYPTCVLHKTTGLLCAGCGCLRAMHELLHGHVGTAFRYNPLLIASLPFLVWFGARQTVRKATNQPMAGIHSSWLWVLLVVLVGFTLMRNVPGMPFATLPQ
jgi:uncharacterized membrane protein